MFLGNFALRTVVCNSFLDRLPNFFNEPDCRLDCIILETSWVQKIIKDRLGGVRSEQMAQVELSDKLNVAEKLMLALPLHVTMIFKGVSLARIFCFLLQHFIILLIHIEDLFVN